MTFDNMVFPSTTAAEVSSHDDSIPSIIAINSFVF
jgi:hypothetical protein